jgi:hypothetical protein
MINFAGWCASYATKAWVTIGDIASNPTAANYAPTRLEIEAKRILVHPEYTFQTVNLKDVGLVLLPMNSQRSANADFAYVYMQDPSIVFNAFYLNRLVKIAGWGRTPADLNNDSPVLIGTTVKIISMATCRAAYPVASDSTMACHMSASTTQVQVCFVAFYYCILCSPTLANK